MSFCPSGPGSGTLTPFGRLPGHLPAVEAPLPLRHRRPDSGCGDQCPQHDHAHCPAAVQPVGAAPAGSCAGDAHHRFPMLPRPLPPVLHCSPMPGLECEAGRGGIRPQAADGGRRARTRWSPLPAPIKVGHSFDLFYTFGKSLLNIEL